MAFATADNPEIFPDVSDILQVKRKYSKLFSEITDELLTIKDHRQERLAVIIKQLRRMFNFLNHDVNLHAKKNVVKTKWFDVAQSYAVPDSRYSAETMKLKNKRVESEQKDGIITMPFLEPYLGIKWPSGLPPNRDKYPNAVIQEYAQVMTTAELDLLNNKRFGV